MATTVRPSTRIQPVFDISLDEWVTRFLDQSAARGLVFEDASAAAAAAVREVKRTTGRKELGYSNESNLGLEVALQFNRRRVAAGRAH